MKVLTTAKGMAKAMNFGKYPVLRINMDTKEGSKAVVLGKSDRYGEMRYRCTLSVDFYKENDGILYLSTECACVKSEYSWKDHLEDAEFANAPVISPDQIIAVYAYSEKARAGFVRMVKSGNINVHCQVATMLKDIEEEKEDEAKESKKHTGKK